MKIDCFVHILPPRYVEERARRGGTRLGSSQYAKYVAANRGLTDLDVRFRVMDQFNDVVQLLTIAGPNVESVAGPEDAAELARIANDELAALVADYPDRFVGAVACLPMNDIDAALREAERALDDLGFRGVEIFTDIEGQPVDSPELMPLYEMMQSRDLPILLHPRGTSSTPDYAGEDRSRYLAFTNFGWPHASSVAMSRFAFGVFPAYPDLKVLTHHAGGMIPFFHKRIELSWDFNRNLMGYGDDGAELDAPPLDYYRRFYCDTAIQGNPAALMCAHDFFGPDRMLFATDAPYDDRLGERLYEETIAAIEAMDITGAERKAIFSENARNLFSLP
ncbi:MAG: amidohydrolase family protein [Gemmatimonadota bacterium]